MDEKAYEQGNRAAWQRILGTAIRELGFGDDVTLARLIHEREAAVSVLRQACPGDWSENDHLADIITKQVVPKLK